MPRDSYESLLSTDASLNTNFISRLFFTWLNGLLKLGYQRPLTDDDLLELSDENKAQDLVNNLSQLWIEELRNAENENRKPRLWKALLKLFSCSDYVFLLAIKYTDVSVQFTLAILVWFYLMYLDHVFPKDKFNAVGIVAGLGITSLIRIFCYHHFDYKSLKLGMKLKIAVIGLIHKKIIECKRSNLAKFSTGQIINLVSNDAKRMEDLAMAVTEFLVIPYIIFGAVLCLSLLVGWQSLSGLLLMFFLMALNFILAQVFAETRIKQAKVTDKRLATMNEIISGIRAVKMYAWEWKYKEMVDNLRRKEIDLIRRKTFIASYFQALLFIVTPLATLISICTLLYSGIRPDTVTMFTVTIILNICTECMTVKIGFHYRNVRDAKVSIDRIEEFLYDTNGIGSGVKNDKFIEEDNLTNRKLLSYDVPRVVQTLTERENKPKIVVTNMSAAWTQDQRPVLCQVSVTVTDNQLLMVTGPVGSGKSLLLMAILGEIPTGKGEIQVHGRIAYVSQIPWIFSGSIRDNILFGEPFDENRFNRILEICDLHKDINCFPNRELTIIGQRGVGLSGGQRARVSLARAVYSDADIFLLDDPLSAVDARVGQHIFDKCIRGQLSNRLRILVTHQEQHLPRADKIARVKGGTIVVGTYWELKDRGVMDNSQKWYDDTSTCGLTLNKESSTMYTEYDDFPGKDMEETEEDRATGTVSWRLYWSFFRIGLPAFLIGCFVLFYIIVQEVLLAPSWWMSRIVHMSYQDQRSLLTLGIFGGLVLAAFLLCLSREYLFDLLLLRSLRTLHNKMVLAVIKSPVLFFDTNPTGRIMNRFSKDIGAMDDLLPYQLTSAVGLCSNVLAVLVFATIVNIWIICAVVPTLLLFLYITEYYLKSSRELKRMEAIRCSPVYDHVAETITGLEVIRTSMMENMCHNKMLRLQNEHTKAFFLVMATSRWFGFYIDLLCAMVLLAVAITGLVGIQDHALAGMLLMLATSLFGITQYGMRMATEVESQMTSVERVMAYTKLPSEPGYSRQDKPPHDWPSQGSLSVKDLCMVYLEGGPSVFKDLNLDIHHKEKIGIVGRTGAGKSSLVAALFRMPDPQGRVLIDGVDVSTINIQDARRSMAVITQDAILFAGSLRKNLDPFKCFTDHEIWTALGEVQMKNKVLQLQHQLEFCVGEGGAGFSVGERQLLCLARALLQKCKILVLDEATANVDYKTDRLIQQVIRQKFTNCTVLTIAHRLNTVMDYDKVMVLEQGHVVEYDNPRVLAGKVDGFFSRLLNTSSGTSL